MLDLGDTATLTAPTVRDADGEPANADTVTLTVTLPDGTTDPQTVTNPPATIGQYTHPYLIVQHGRHVVRWTFTGSVPDQAYADVFSAADSSWPALVGLIEVKEHLNYPASDTTDDEELRGFILSASEVVEDITGVTSRREFTETYSGGERAILLRRRPVLGVSAVTVDGTVVDAGDYTVSSSGILAHRFGRWPRGFRNVEVTYEAGRVAVSASVLDATKELIRINWRPQAGGNHPVFDGGRTDEFGAPEFIGQGEVRLGFFVPNTVMQRLMPSARAPHVA